MKTEEWHSQREWKKDCRMQVEVAREKEKGMGRLGGRAGYVVCASSAARAARAGFIAP